MSKEQLTTDDHDGTVITPDSFRIHMDVTLGGAAIPAQTLSLDFVSAANVAAYWLAHDPVKT